MPKPLDWPDEVKAYIRDNVVGKSNKALTDKVNALFGTRYTPAQISGYKKRNGLKSGIDGRFIKGQTPHNKGMKGLNYPGQGKTQFKKGEAPHNKAKVGDEVITREGYLKVKIAEPNVWEFKQRLAWEQHNGPIPKGSAVIFLDGDQLNCDISNLECVTKNENLILNRQKLRRNDVDLTRTGVLVAKVIAAGTDAKRRKIDAKG